MKNLIKKAALWAVGLLVFLTLLAGAAVFTLYRSGDGLSTDWDSLKSTIRLQLFRHNIISVLTPDEVTRLYQGKCYRKCHGESAMITVVLPSAGWFQLVERMRVKENVDITGTEAEAIIRHLDEKYPKTKSRFTYEVRKQVHNTVWRNDMGQGDIYCDVIYVSREYLISIGAEHLIDEYDVAHYHVYLINFTVHEGEIALSDLDKITELRTPLGVMPTTPPWRLRFQTADKHHYEGIVRFDKSNPVVAKPEAAWLELAIKGIGGSATRTYKWDRDLKYPEELKNAVTVSKEASK